MINRNKLTLCIEVQYECDLCIAAQSVHQLWIEVQHPNHEFCGLYFGGWLSARSAPRDVDLIRG